MDTSANNVNSATMNPKDIVGNPANPIDVSSLSSGTQTKPVGVPQTPPSTTAAGLNAKINSLVSSAQSNATDSKNTYEDLVNQIAGVQGSQATEEANANIPKLTQDVTDAQNALNASKAAREAELNSLSGQGLTDIQKAQQTAEINRKYATGDLTLGVALSAAQGNLTTAKNLVDSKIKLELEPLQTKLDQAKQFYQDNQAQLTKAQDIQIQQQIKDLDTQLAQAQKDKGEVATYTKSLVDQGKATPQLLQALDGAKNGAEAAKILTQNGVNLDKPSSQIIGSASEGYHNVVKDSNGKVISITPLAVGGSGSGQNPKFSNTQINKGANNAGLNLDEFKKQSPSVQNYFINAPASVRKAFADDKAAVANGTKSVDDVKADIDSSNATDEVKTYLKNQIDSVKKPSTSAGIWSRVKNFFQ